MSELNLRYNLLVCDGMVFGYVVPQYFPIKGDEEVPPFLRNLNRLLSFNKLN